MRRRWSAAALALTGCLASPPASTDGGVDDPADAAPPEPPIDVSLIGDLLTLDFNDDTGSYLLVDRSGGSRHADLGGGAFLAGGVFGAARTLNGGGTIFLPRDVDLGPGAGSGFTLEAYVLLDTGGQVATVASDYLASDPTVTFDLQLQNETTLQFTSNADGEEGSVPSDSIALPLQTWSHVAVTWNGAALVFYLDGMPVGTHAGIATISIPDDNRFVHIGGRADGSAPLLGAVDEVKISSYAKSQGEIQASMAYDTRDLVGRCGDDLLEDGEECAGAGLCCSDACATLAGDPVCADAGGTCSDGLCKVADATRVESGIVAYYTFDEVMDGGSRIPDRSDVGTPADLLASAEVESQDGGVTLDGDNVLRTVAASKIAEQCIETDEVTVEAWVSPAADGQLGPARVVTYSNGIMDRNFMIGQDGDLWVGRVRTLGTDSNGLPMIGSAGAAPRSAQLSHLVLTAAGDQRRFYVDGKLRSSGRFQGSFNGWAPDYQLLVGDEEGGARAWKGSIHLLAIYDRALDDLEVATNYAAGPDPL